MDRYIKDLLYIKFFVTCFVVVTELCLQWPLGVFQVLQSKLASLITLLQSESGAEKADYVVNSLFQEMFEKQAP
jgi:hypothetical protein